MRLPQVVKIACLLCAATLPFAVQAQFTYTTNNSTITITAYTGYDGVVTIPSSFNFLPVKIIGSHAFYFCNELTSVMIPDNVTGIGDFAFGFCWNMTNATIGRGVTSIGTGRSIAASP